MFIVNCTNNFCIKSGEVLSHSSTLAWESQRRAFADWDHTGTSMAYWPSSVSMGTKKPFLPLLRLESYLLLFYLGEAHRDYLEAQCCCSAYLYYLYLEKYGLTFGAVLNISASFDKIHLVLDSSRLTSSLCCVVYVYFCDLRHIWIVALNTRVQFSDLMKALSSMDHARLSSLHLTCFLGWVSLTSHCPDCPVSTQTWLSEDYHEQRFRLIFLGFLVALMSFCLPGFPENFGAVSPEFLKKLSQPVQAPHLPSSPPSWGCLCLAEKNLCFQHKWDCSHSQVTCV